MLSSLLEGLVGAPVVTRQSIEEAMAAAEGADAPEAGALSPTEEREVRSQVFTNHYRGVLDEPLPVLDGMTPRAAARTADSRDKVVAWLKSLENGQALSGPDNAMAGYGLGWMWSELGLAEYRRRAQRQGSFG